MIIARERYKHFHVPRSHVKEVVRVLHTKALGDQVDGFQGVIGPAAIFVRELIHFTLVTLSLLGVGRKWMQILARRWVRVFQLRPEGMSCFNEVLKFLYSCHGSQVLPSAVRQSCGQLVLFPLFRVDLRVLVDCSVVASDASLSCGAICRSIGLTARGLEAAKQAQALKTSLCHDEVLFCIDGDLGAGRRAMELFRLDVAAFIWSGTDPHAERICRHAWSDGSRFSHSYVKWVFVFSACCSIAKKSLLCQKQNDPDADPSSVAQLCVCL